MRTGYKEFFPVVLPKEEGVVSNGVSSGGLSCKELQEKEIKDCLNIALLRSLQYARQQRKWIRNKFLIRQKNLPLYFFETNEGNYNYNLNSCCYS